MKKIVLMLLAMVVFGNVLGANWLPSTNFVNGQGIKVNTVYFHPASDNPSNPTDMIVFYSDTDIYVYKYSTIGGEMPSKAKAILSMLLSAKSSGAGVFVLEETSSMTNMHEFSLLMVGK